MGKLTLRVFRLDLENYINVSIELYARSKFMDVLLFDACVNPGRFEKRDEAQDMRYLRAHCFLNEEQ